MKTFAIIDKATNQIVETYEADAIDDSSANRSYLRSAEYCHHVEIPEGIDPSVAAYGLIPTVPAIADKWTKEGEEDSPIEPQVEVADDSWEHHDAVEGEAEFWSKDGEESVYEDPQDESWEHHPAVDPVAEFWSKDGYPNSDAQPMKRIADESWTYVPGSAEIPEHMGIVESDEKKVEANAAALAAFSAQRSQQAEEAINALLSPMDQTTHLMVAMSLMDAALNITENKTEQEISEAKSALADYRVLMGQIQGIRAQRDEDIAAFSPPYTV